MNEVVEFYSDWTEALPAASLSLTVNCSSSEKKKDIQLYAFQVRGTGE